MEDKKSLASEEELAMVEGKTSLLAAVDYFVSMHSDVFISASPGNMHNAVVSLKSESNFQLYSRATHCKKDVLTENFDSFSWVIALSRT